VFDTLLSGNAPPQCSNGQCNGPRSLTAATPQEIEDLLTQMPPRLAARVAEWRDHPRVTSLREETRARLFRLVQRTAQWVADGSVDEEAAVRLINWLEPLLRR